MVSGTPAKETSDADGCATLGGLLGFLRHPKRSLWKGVARRLLARAEGAEDAALAFLTPIMVRNLKRKIAVPHPIRSTSFLECSAAERLAYNSLVAFFQANLVLTGLQGAVTGAGADVSLLHHNNLKSARKAVENVRLASNGGGKQLATLSPHYFRECCAWLSERYRAPSRVVERACVFMTAAQSGDATPCDKCGLPLLLQLLMPMCGHLCCPECVDSASAAAEAGGEPHLGDHLGDDLGEYEAARHDALPALRGGARHDARHAGGTRELCACPVCAEALPELEYLKCPRCDDVVCSHGERRVLTQAHPLDAFAYVQPGFDLQ